MIRRPPRSTLSPTRRSSDLHVFTFPKKLAAITTPACVAPRRRTVRSEEHTSELQSHEHLVCRLLLDTKSTPRQVSTRPRVRRGYSAALQATLWSITNNFFLIKAKPPEFTPFPSREAFRD